MQGFKSFLESKAFIVAFLTTIAAGVAHWGVNVPVQTIVLLLTPIMVSIGALGWGEGVVAKARMDQETQIKMHLLTHGVKAADLHAAYQLAIKPAPRVAIVASGTVGALVVGIMLSTSLGGVTGCAWWNRDVRPVVTDVVECVRAEAAVASSGFSIMQILNEVAAAFKSTSDFTAAITSLIAKYGGDIVACAIDNYPRGSTPALLALDSKGTCVIAPIDTPEKRAAALERFFPGKKINHSSKN